MIELDVLSHADVAADGQPKQWRSFAHRDGAPGAMAIAADEFHPAAGLEGDGAATGPDRRTFVKLMGASMALAGLGLAGCRRPVEKVMPYVRQPEEVTPGVPNFYATAMPMHGVVHPILVENHEGRPTKVEGNPEHPAARGKSDRFAQASILNLYDPDRTRFIRRGGAESTLAEFTAFVRQMRANAGARMAILAEPTSSLTVARLREQVAQQFPASRWITYRSGGDDTAAAGVASVAGPGRRPLYRFSRAQTIVSFDADFVTDPVSGVWNSREFADSRRVQSPQDEMSRLYVIESTMTPTGGMADHRLRMRASDIPFFAAAVADALGESAGTAGQYFAGDARIAAFIQAIAEDAAAGQTVFVAGQTQPAAVHALCARLNASVAGDAVELIDTGEEPDEQPQGQALTALAREMRAGNVDAVICIGCNPVYDAPAALDFATAFDRVQTTITLSHHRDETAQRATWAVPRAHYLEAWGDGRAIDGTISVIQPLIAPLFPDARSEIELLALLATGEPTTGYDLVRQTFSEQGLLTGRQEDAWRTILHDGFVQDSAFPVAGAAGGGEGAELQLAQTAPDRIELVIRPDQRMLDGTFSNNAWMLELPEPISKLTWDNVAVMSPTTAQDLGVRWREGSYEGGVVRAGRINASMVTITVQGVDPITVPAWVQPGHPDGSITLTTGWGRRLETDRTLQTDRGLLARIFDVDTDHYRYGPLANEIGVRVGHLRPTDGPAVIPNVEVEVASGTHSLASTQDHGSMEGRPIVRSATLSEFRERPYFAEEAVPLIADTPWEEFPPAWGEESSAKANPRISQGRYSDHQWGMTIDLNVCNGCNACVVACQSENNISVVGKSEVERGREMHWLRIDRYYMGDDAAEAGMAMMPMLCQQCEYAPCEAVCPVAATSHSPDGLNEMTYNRCIGTRYCSNNCPYKVRRYNWFNWSIAIPLEARMQLNPNVTVRTRGVMEKCTWCVQRIRAAGRYARIEGRKIADGEIQTACQQACPSDAILFGDIADPDSRVSQHKRTARRYELLAEYNIKPRLSYMARISNPNPRLQAALGQTTAPTS